MKLAFKNKLLLFFKKNPYPSDDNIESLAKKIGIDDTVLEEEINKILSTILSGGLAKQRGITRNNVDQNELKMGIKVEMEHVDPTSPYAEFIAERIALDHLAEHKDYYTKLKVIEGY